MKLVIATSRRLVDLDGFTEVFVHRETLNISTVGWSLKGVKAGNTIDLSLLGCNEDGETAAKAAWGLIGLALEQGRSFVDLSACTK